jgi:hypothetical protein
MANTRSLPDTVTLADPRPGTVVCLAPGSRLHLRLRSGLVSSRWHVASLPGNLLPLVREVSELSFLVFDGAPATLRLERRHPRSDVVREMCELRIEVSEAAELAEAGRRSA